ncbi:MAG: hypothetical protein KatS3mg131_2515 [Candidatus Tectimicrobiota bacterium]|nr:MAG: hypothetical protein KatS3mg131_2515 [Candidatus Tectomicrobia bacterium]
MNRSREGPVSRQCGIVRMQALRYRCLQYIDQPLAPFQLLVGPNASGKSTFLDVVAFVGDLLRTDLDAAVRGDPRTDVPHRGPRPEAPHVAA